jgi:hypothetical protein
MSVLGPCQSRNWELPNALGARGNRTAPSTCAAYPSINHVADKIQSRFCDVSLGCSDVIRRISLRDILDKGVMKSSFLPHPGRLAVWSRGASPFGGRRGEATRGIE